MPWGSVTERAAPSGWESRSERTSSDACVGGEYGAFAEEEVAVAEAQVDEGAQQEAEAAPQQVDAGLAGEVVQAQLSARMLVCWTAALDVPLRSLSS